MTPIQKAVCRSLLKSAYSSGFEGLYPLAPIAASLNTTVSALFDLNSNTGDLFEISQFGEGLLYVHGSHAGVSFDLREMVEEWSREEPVRT